MAKSPEYKLPNGSRLFSIDELQSLGETLMATTLAWVDARDDRNDLTPDVVLAAHGWIVGSVLKTLPPTSRHTGLVNFLRMLSEDVLSYVDEDEPEPVTH